MKTRTILAEDPGSLELALSILHEGGLVAFPTDTVYGLGALPFDEAAVESIYQAKGRPLEKAIPVLLAGLDDLERIAASVPPLARKLADHFWPGPLTLVVPRQPFLPAAVSNNPGVAVRIPDHPVARRLLQAAGPMAVTSANASGEPSALTALEVARQLQGQIPLILDGGEAPGGIPSTLVDCLGEIPVILRQGPITLEQLQRALESP
jgi:L-threonylcarbamoyladenylate synthase